jgi:hypothetical protein
MTPQLQKRRDGLAPSLLDLDKKSFDNSKTSHSKSYRTSSRLLKYGGDPEKELQSLVDSIHSTLEHLVDTSKTTTHHVIQHQQDFASVTFEPQGCMWRMDFHPNTKASEGYQILVICSACDEGHGDTAYVTETSLVTKGKTELESMSGRGYKEAKAVFDLVALATRKASVKCEFPDFPEGCKGKTFREVYQLNARVSNGSVVAVKRGSCLSLFSRLSFNFTQLKSGSFATVCRGTHRGTGKKVAIKCVLRKDLPPSDDAAIYDEVAILASLDHPHIVPLIDFFDEKDCYFIVMELMSGGDLFDRIGKKKSYSEADARDLVIKMLKAMAYCHNRNIAHCDMKPKNLLLVVSNVCRMRVCVVL